MLLEGLEGTSLSHGQSFNSSNCSSSASSNMCHWLLIFICLHQISFGSKRLSVLKKDGSRRNCLFVRSSHFPNTKLSRTFASVSNEVMWGGKGYGKGYGYKGYDMWNPMMNPMMMQQPGQVVGDFFGMDRIDKDAREFCDEQNKTVVKISSLWQGVGKDIPGGAEVWNISRIIWVLFATSANA